MRLVIGGVERTQNLMTQTLRITDQLNANSAASFVLRDRLAGYRPMVGEEVRIYDEDDALVFGGSVDEPEEELQRGSSIMHYDIPAVDHHDIANRRIVAETYDGWAAGDIVLDVISEYLSEEGVTAGSIQAGPIATRAVFNYITAGQALDDLSELTGFQWTIRPDKRLDFFNRSTFRAPWDADETADIIDPKISRNRRGYRNRQYVRAGHDISDPRTESFKGDGEARTFTVALPIAKVPTVLLNGIPQTVGIQGIDSDRQWYWNKGQKEITQDQGDTRLGDTDILRVTYQGLFPIIVVADDAGQQADRKKVEGGTGIYEQVEQDANLDSQQAAMELAEGRLRRYARIATTLTYSTYRNDLRPGMIQYVYLPEYGLSGDFLISEIQTVDIGRADGRLRRDLTLLDGEAVGGWTTFFKQLVQSGQQFVIRENEVLVKMIRLTDKVICSDILTISSGAPESKIGYAMIGYAEVS